jgi:hypothetical protein
MIWSRRKWRGWSALPVLMKKPGALRNGAPFKDWDRPPALTQVRKLKPQATDPTAGPSCSNLWGPESRHAWLINEAVETPLQFSKSRKMIFQLRKPLFDSEELFCAI